MNPKEIAVPSVLTLVIVLLVTLTSVQGAYSEEAENRVFYSLDYGGLLIEVEAPVIAWPGDDVNVTLRAEASAKIHIVSIELNVSSLREGREEVPLLRNATFLGSVDLNPGMLNETTFTATIPGGALPGLIYGKVAYTWQIRGTTPATLDILPQAFPATFIENEPYIRLKEDFDLVNSAYNSLQANYTSLNATYTGLLLENESLKSDQIEESNATSLMYLFLVTTGVFVITTILLLAKRPQTTTW
jgi:hypothetical protein